MGLELNLLHLPFFLISGHIFIISEKISAMTPYFFLFKMIADILDYIISKSGTLFNFGNFKIGFFSSELKFQKIMKKFSTTISVIKYTMIHIL